MKILIVDDKPVFAGELRQYVNKICLDNRVTAEIQITDDVNVKYKCRKTLI